MGSKKKISKHPNPYVLADEIKTQLVEASDTVVAETVTNHQAKVKPRRRDMLDRKKGLMNDLAKRNIDLETYLISMGANSLKYQPQIQKDPDPLVDSGLWSGSEVEDDDDDLEEGLASDEDSLDEDDCPETFAPPSNVASHTSFSQAPPTSSSCTYSSQASCTSSSRAPRPSSSQAPRPSSSQAPRTSSSQAPVTSSSQAPRTSSSQAPRSQTAQNKKGKRKKQKPIPESEESFLHVESLADLDAPGQASIGGADLRNLRREQAGDENDDTSSSVLSAAAVASAGITVLSRFVSRSSASRSSPRRSSVGRRMSINRRTSSIASPLTTPARTTSPARSSGPYSAAKQRVESLGFRFSSSQPFTKGDGNCMLYAIWDQLKRCDHPILQHLKTPHDLRLYVCSKLKEQLDGNFIFWVQNFSPDSWLETMRKDREWCDDVFLQITANIFNKNVILIPLSPSSAHHAGMYLDVRSVNGGSGDPFFMLYFEEWRMAGHYQSLEQDPKVRYNMVLAHFNWRSKSLVSTSSVSLSDTPTPDIPSTLLPPTLPTLPSDPTQLHSTRQRLESDGIVTFSQVLSPISSRETRSENTTNQTG